MAMSDLRTAQSLSVKSKMVVQLGKRLEVLHHRRSTHRSHHAAWDCCWRRFH